VFLIHCNLCNHRDGSVVSLRRFSKGRHRWRQTRLYVKRLDEIERQRTCYTASLHQTEKIVR